MTEHEAVSFHQGKANGETFGRALVAAQAPKRATIPGACLAGIIDDKVKARGWSWLYYNEGYRLGLKQSGVGVSLLWEEHLDRLRALWIQDAKDEILAANQRDAS